MHVGQTRLLAQTFFGRLFESELMPQGLPQMQLLVWGLVFAGGPTLGLPLLLTKKYTRMYVTGGLPLAMATDRVILYTLSMLSIGFVGLLIWDGIFPDKRDVRILGPLPVRMRTFVAARLIAIGRLFVLFGAAICIPQTVIFGLLTWSYGDPAGLVRGLGGHFIAAAAACVFVFSTLVALQCLLLSTLGRRVAQRASVILQLTFAIALVQLLFFIPQIGEVLRNRDHMLASASGGAVLLPGVWFLGLYEVLGGFGGPAASSLARLAVMTPLIMLATAVLLYTASYKRLSRLALEGVAVKPKTERRPRRRAMAAESIPAHAITVAVRDFTMRTLVRTRQHRMILALYTGIALAVVLSSLLSLVLSRRGLSFKPSVPLLSIPLVLQFLPLLGIRMVAAIPAEPKANWLFRAAEPVERAHAIDGMRDAMNRAVVLPTTGVALLEGGLLWGIVPGICHALFCWALGRLLIEILLVGFFKIPFTCSYLPGRARIRTMWPFYLMAFTTYCYTLARVELALFRSPVRLLAFCAILLIARELVAYARRRALAGEAGLRFIEEDPDALFDGFRLSEGLAATARSSAD